MGVQRNFRGASSAPTDHYADLPGRYAKPLQQMRAEIGRFRDGLATLLTVIERHERRLGSWWPYLTSGAIVGLATGAVAISIANTIVIAWLVARP